jgi:DNA (cytosine-5)-methyltransferase 1
MRYLSVCSGIEAATVAWHPLGWQPIAFSEVDAFPSAVLAHHYPSVPNLGDMTQFQEWPDAVVDVLVGGTPCQSFSVAGRRKGLGDPRGNLMLTFGAIAQRYRPQWLVWENVPGVLSSNGGRDFGTFLGMLGELGYGFAYRILDAQFFGVAQRRRRVFVVGCAGSWQRAAAVLFERESLRGNPPPRREARKDAAGSTHDGIVGSLCADTHSGAYSGQDAYTGRLIAHALRVEAFAASEDGTGRGTPLVPVTFQPRIGRNGRGYSEDVIHALNGSDAGATSDMRPCVAFPANLSGTQCAAAENLAPSMGAKNPTAVANAMHVRRLTPRECERLQGFPDDYTLIPYRNKPAAQCPDGPRYKALGNSMAVPCMRWIGERIAMVENIQESAA